MTTYYLLSAEYGGNDVTGTGLSPDASSSAKPWASLAKALGSGTPVTAGDQIWVGPGVCWGSTVTVTTGVSTTASPLKIYGDPLNTQGFRDSTGLRVAPGVPWLTSRLYIDGRDTGNFTGSPTLCDASSSTAVNGVQWKNLAFDTRRNANNGNLMVLTFNGNSDWLFEDCLFVGGFAFSYLAGSAATAGRNLTVRRCVIHARVLDMANTVAAATADADMAILFEGNILRGQLAPSTPTFATAASGGNLAGGIRFKGNYWDCEQPLATVAAKVSTVTPIRVEGNLFMVVQGIAAGTSGQIVSDGNNRFSQITSHTNFTMLGTDLYMPLMDQYWPTYYKWGLCTGDAAADAPFGWTPDAASTLRQNGWSASTIAEFRGRTARPWGAGAAIGAFECGSVGQATNNAITSGGSSSGRITGAGELGYEDVQLDGTFDTIRVVTASTGYGGTSYPQLTLEANPAAGLGTTQTATASSASEQTLTISGLTGVVGPARLRMVSRSTSTSSLTYFDRLAAA